VVRYAIVAALAGCGFSNTLGLGMDNPLDADASAGSEMMMPDAALGPWTTPTPMSVMAGVDDPSLTDDRLELYFNANGDIYITTRQTLTSAWSGAQVVATLSTASETTPEVSYDGLTIFVSSDRTGTLGSQDIFSVTRANRGAAWGTPAPVPNINSPTQETSSVMTPDGLVIVMTSQRGTSNSSDLFTSVRSSPTGAWATPIEQTALTTATHEGSPFLSADGLTIYFDSDKTGNNDLYYAHRNSVNDLFPPAVPVPDINTSASEEDAWLSADGRHLVFYSDRSGMPGLWESSR
jgi:Tol biopolymer transport system component